MSSGRFFPIIFLLLNSLLFAQPNKSGDGIISGKIIDRSTEKAIEYASFRLFRSSDSTLVSGVFSDFEGKFTLEQIPDGSYYGIVSFTGYELLTISDIKISSILKAANLGIIKLEVTSTKSLKEVEIIGQQEMLKTGLDKKVYNVGEDLSVKGGTANDILYNIPSVSIDQEGNVSLRGEGTVNILIDGRPSALSGGNGKTLLDALPAGSIDRIEIVTNPSSKYDPDGSAGIINIVLKKNKLRGFNGMINGNLGSGNIRTGNVGDGNISLSFRNSKVNVYGSYNKRYLEGYRNNYSDIKQAYENKTMYVNQKREGTDLNTGNTFRLGVDFYLKPRHALMITTTGNIGERNRTGDQLNKRYSDASDVIQWRRTSNDPTQQHNLDLNLNYKFDFKADKGTLTADLTQSFGREDIQGYYENDTLLMQMQTIIQQLFNTEQNNVTTAQADILRLFPKIGGRLETGVKTILRKQLVNTYSERLDTLSGEYQEDTLANFNYKYNEAIYSFYTMYGQQFKKIRVQGGLRVEKAYQIPNLVSDSVRIINDYLNLFPSGHIRYSLKEKSELSLSYSRRITRATSANLNPFTSYADPYNLQRGNPYLQPEYIDSYDLGYVNEFKKATLTFSIFYRHNTAVISRIKEFYPNNTSAVTYKNLDQSNSIGIEAVCVLKPFKWWRNTLSFNGNYIEYNDSQFKSNWNASGINWNFKYIGVVDFWKKTASIQLTALYNAPRVTIQGTAQRRGPVDLAGDKSFKQGKWTIGMRISDIFNRQGFYMTVNQNGIQQTSEFKWLTRRFYLTFSYKFGKMEITNKAKLTNPDGGTDM